MLDLERSGGQSIAPRGPGVVFWCVFPQVKTSIPVTLRTRVYCITTARGTLQLVRTQTRIKGNGLYKKQEI